MPWDDPDLPLDDPRHQGPDEDLWLTCWKDGARHWNVFEPTAASVVLARFNLAARELNLEACRRDKIGLFRRRGGGGAVVLAPGMAVVSVAERTDHPMAQSYHFSRYSGRIVSAIETLGITGIHCRGTSDLVLGERKLVGSTLYFRGDLVFFQASLLVTADLSLIPKYLAHPSREPDYRAGRPHLSFVTTLQEIGYQGTMGQVLEALKQSFSGATDPPPAPSCTAI